MENRVCTRALAAELKENPQSKENHEETTNKELNNKNPIKGVTMVYLNIDNALRIIPEFNGNSLELDRFLACCDIVALDLTEAESRKFLKLLPAKLTNKAYELYKYKNFTSFEELKIEFKLHFSEKRSLESLKIELFNIKQKQSETVREFSSRVEKLLSDINNVSTKDLTKAQVSAIINLNNSSALKSFIEGLNHPIRLIVKASRPQTLNDATNIAFEEELLNLNRPSTSKIFNNSNKKFKCYSCGKFGHTANYCHNKHNLGENSFQNKPTTSFYSTNDNSKFSTYEKLFCSYCKNKGHLIKDCRKKKYSDSHSIKRTEFSSQQIAEPESRTNDNNSSGNENGQQQTSTPVRVLDI